MKALFLVRDLPESRTSGYKKRNFYLLDELKKTKVDVVLFREDQIGGVSKKTNKLTDAFMSLFSVLPFSIRSRYLPKVKERIENYLAANQVDIIICDSIYRALNIPLKSKCKKILFEHNIESIIIKRYADSEKNIFKKIFAYIEYLKLSDFEKKMWGKFDCVIACSSLDKVIMEQRASDINVFVIKNGVDSDFFASNSKMPIDNDTLIYTGQIGWHPNEDAVIYFIKSILPLIRKEKPQIKFWVVGDGPSERIRGLADKDKSIMITGFVDDVRSFIQKASVFVVPLRIGGGTRLKILEALSMRKAVVSTSIGCEGLDVEDNKNILIKDEPEEFAGAVLNLLKNETLRASLGNNGRKLVEEKYEWSAVFKNLDDILEAVKI